MYTTREVNVENGQTRSRTYWQVSKSCTSKTSRGAKGDTDKRGVRRTSKAVVVDPIGDIMFAMRQALSGHPSFSPSILLSLSFIPSLVPHKATTTVSFFYWC